MSSFSIDIFDSNNSNNTIVNSSINPSFNHNIGESTNKLNFRPESSSISAPDLLPINNNDERFKQNQVINGKTRYEQDNTIIKSLEEEIVNMKHKLSFVYEKDEEIGKLNEEIISLKKQLEGYISYSEEVVSLRLENNKLNGEILLLQNKLKQELLVNESLTNDSTSEDNDLIKQLNEKIELLESELLKNELKGKNIISNSTISKTVIEDIDEMIDINVPHLREVLTNRLKTKQMEHIETLIDSYGLRRTNQVKKSVMEEMLEQAIHI
uniref:Uncharacterized protein n=1 Tax=viral metagenome TaxID=1070528 RepID=A0A6C0CEZ9_9ZZZZ